MRLSGDEKLSTSEDGDLSSEDGRLRSADGKFSADGSLWVCDG